MNKQLYLLVDRYYNSELSETEKKDIEEKARNNPELARLLSVYRNTEFALKNKNLIEFITNSQQVEEAYFAGQNSKRILHSRRMLFAVAASIILLIGMMYIILMDLNRKDSKQLFTSYFKPYNSITPRNSNNDQSDFQKGYLFYIKDDYEKSIPYFENHLKALPENQFTRLYLSCAYLQNEDTDKAVSCLNEILESNHNELHNTARWYLAMACLKRNSTEKVIAYLNEIILSTDKAYQDEAMQLMYDNNHKLEK